MSIPHPLSALRSSLDDVAFNLVINLLPDEVVSNSFLRPALARLFGLRCGRGTQIRDRIFYEEHRKLVIGANVLLNRMAYVDAGGGITIGDNVRFGPGVMLVTGSHEIGDPAMRTGELIAKPIVIGEGCWLGARAFIGPGVTIGPGSIVSAGSVVQRAMPANFMIAGNPARPVSPLGDAGRTPEAAASSDAPPKDRS
jgi:acetyltransferase-like isoleucine patch superfamily enzyme